MINVIREYRALFAFRMGLAVFLLVGIALALSACAARITDESNCIKVMGVCPDPKPAE